MRINLSSKIIGVVFLISFIILSVSFYINIRIYTEGLTDSFIERAKATVYSLEAGIESRKDIQDKAKLLSSVHKNIWLDPEIIEISFNLPQGNGLITYVSNNPNNINKTPDTNNFNAYRNNVLINKIIKTESSKILRIIAPMHISGQVEGTIQIDFTLENVNSKINSAMNTLILTYSSMMVLLVLSLFFFLRHIIVKPILEINKGVESIARGNLNYRVKLKSKDEIGKLASAFNHMTEHLKKSRAEIKKYSKGLEKQVAERTKELEKSKEELEAKVDEMERFSKLTVGRELKMIELKKKIKELERKLKKK